MTELAWAVIGAWIGYVLGLSILALVIRFMRRH